MKSVTVDFHNEVTEDTYSKHKTSIAACVEVGNVLDEWKTLIIEENATNVCIQMVYMDGNKRVAVQELDLMPNSIERGTVIVESEGIALEMSNPEETVALFNTFCDNAKIAVKDNYLDIDEDDINGRIQQILLNPSSEDPVVIDVIRKK